MAAPDETVWGSIAYGNGESSRGGRIGLYFSSSSTNTSTTYTVQVWFWSKYGVSDPENTLYFDWWSAPNSAVTDRGTSNIQTTVSSGGGWSTSNQVLLGTYSFSYDRGTSDSTKYLYAKLTGVNRVNATMYVNTTVTIPKLAYWTVKYDANGGSGAPSSQTKWCDKNLTLSSTKPTRTGYSFQGWATSASGSVVYSDTKGMTYTADTEATLYAVWKPNTYKVSFDANGGNLGKVPTYQTKTHDVTLKLDTNKPTRTNYNFLGWSTSKSATTAQYDPGDDYTTEAPTILYAVWQLAYTKPRIENFKAERCNQAGVPTEDGTCVHVTATWECDDPVVEVTASWYGNNYGVSDVGGEGTTGFVDIVIGDNLISTEHAYDIFLYVRDGGDDDHSSTKTATITSYKFHIDCKPGINPGVAVGKVAELEGVFDVALTSRFLGNRYCMSSPGEAGYAGYVNVAKIDNTDANADFPITFLLTQKTAATPMTVHIRFDYSETDDKILPTITYEGSNYGAFLVHTNTSEWDLYVQKANAYDTITIQDWYTSKATDGRINVVFPGTLVNEIPQGLDGWYRATPAVLRSIIDCIMPVGFVLTLYSHADPNNMYPGTTWTRIQNAFLWGCDASGTIGQTGGEKTHTLTVSEIPSHTHNIRWTTNNQSGPIQTYPVDTTYNEARGYSGIETNATGGGAAHNNMPPYVQVSIWRRTA